MSDMSEVFKAMREDRKERHQDFRKVNTAILSTCGIEYTIRPEAFLFRERGKPKVDFYPSTGRWKDCRDSKVYSGGALKFLEWYKKQ